MIGGEPIRSEVGILRVDQLTGAQVARPVFDEGDARNRLGRAGPGRITGHVVVAGTRRPFVHRVPAERISVEVLQRSHPEGQLVDTGHEAAIGHKIFDPDPFAENQRRIVHAPQPGVGLDEFHLLEAHRSRPGHRQLGVFGQAHLAEFHPQTEGLGRHDLRQPKTASGHVVPIAGRRVHFDRATNTGAQHLERAVAGRQVVFPQKAHERQGLEHHLRHHHRAGSGERAAVVVLDPFAGSRPGRFGRETFPRSPAIGDREGFGRSRAELFWRGAHEQNAGESCRGEDQSIPRGHFHARVSPGASLTRHGSAHRKGGRQSGVGWQKKGGRGANCRMTGHSRPKTVLRQEEIRARRLRVRRAPWCSG